RGFLFLPVLVLLAGCGAAGDPYAREGTWHATNDNDANLRAMLEDQRDLLEGRGTTRSLGAEAAPPVDRLFSGTRYPLPDLSASGIGTTAPGAGAQPQAAPQTA